MASTIVQISNKPGQTWVSASGMKDREFIVKLDIDDEDMPYWEALVAFHGGENADLTAHELCVSWRSYWALKDLGDGKPERYSEIEFFTEHGRFAGAVFHEDVCPFCTKQIAPDQDLLVWPCSPSRSEAWKWFTDVDDLQWIVHRTCYERYMALLNLALAERE